VSAHEPIESSGGRTSSADTVGAFLCAFAIFFAAISIVWHPLRLVVISALLALIGSAMTKQRIGFVAVCICAASFFLGMVVAVVFKKPLW
jgi:hypothetical protein